MRTKEELLQKYRERCETLNMSNLPFEVLVDIRDALIIIADRLAKNI